MSTLQFSNGLASCLLRREWLHCLASHWFLLSRWRSPPAIRCVGET